MRNSTIGKQMGFLKWFLRWSFKKGHHQNMAYDTFKPKLKTTSKNGDIPDLGRIEQAERLSDTERQTISGACQGRFPVLLLHKSAIFRCS